MTDSRRKTGYVVIANEIWEEVIRRDFSKRQKDILLFLWRLSYGCNRETAHVPMLKDFSLCGVGKTNITNELKYLEQRKVIVWERNCNDFSFNEDFECWEVSPVRGWDDVRFKELLRTNLVQAKKRGRRVIETITVTETNSEPEKGASEVLKTITDSTSDKLSKQEPENEGTVIETITENEKELLKQESSVIETITSTTDEPIQDAASKAPKYSLNTIKDKDIKDMSISDFDLFWNVYPKKAAKKAAQNMWDRAIKEKVKPEILILCSKHYAEHCSMNRTESNFIMHGSTFLNPKNERYADFTEPVVQVENVTVTNKQNKGKLFSQNKELLLSRMQEGRNEQSGNHRIDVTDYHSLPPS